MFVEAFHRKLKTVYFEKKQNCRVDKLLFTLLKISRDLILEAMRKDEIGKRTHRKCEIRKRCQTAIVMKNSGVAASFLSENTWNVRSCSNNAVYTVHLSKESCDCQLKCPNCGACVHMYVCSCVDHAVHYTVCKHTHLVHMQLHNDRQKIVNESQNMMEDNGISPAFNNLERNLAQSDNCERATEEENTTVTEDQEYGLEKVDKEYGLEKVDNDSTVGLEYYKELLQSSSAAAKSLISSKQVFQDKVSELQLLARKESSYEIINTVCSHLTSAISVLKASREVTPSTISSINVKKWPAPNSNFEKQLRFHSTKKKRKSLSRWAKPSREEECSKETMDSVRVEVCGICKKQDSDQDNSDIVDWIECSKCNLWVHVACASCDIDDDYLCFNCT
uniref:SWIM-type domain-containing protein n=1 Tax=Amphimedon queenslandica TaxID=400682 RepID=A0A1X7TQ09_AMPQE